MALETIIGLEVHVQLKTKSKMFCGCGNPPDRAEPNTYVCEVCMGHPGTLPVPNRSAIEWAVRTALALNCEIQPKSVFERKHYFYPDLPKGYQISQHGMPIAKGGWIEVERVEKGDEWNMGDRGVRRVRIERLQLEEDTAKLLHTNDGTTLIDFNRCGVPLLEIVSEPDIRSPQEARAYLQEMREIIRAIGVSDADMEKGQLRCDANLSVRLKGEEKLNTKIEIKNLNSFRAVEKALAFEQRRLSKLLQEGAYPTVQETKGWNDATGETELQRRKEEAEDYRYFPDPDIPPLQFDEDFIGRVRAAIPELPHERRARFVREFRFSQAQAHVLVSDALLADYTEKVISELIAWLSSIPGEGTEDEIWQKYGEKLAKLVYGWLTSKLGGILAARGETMKNLKATPEDFAEFLTLVFNKTISSTIAQELLMKMVETGHDPHELLADLGGGQVQDTSAISSVVEQVINANPDVVAQFKKGKEGSIMFLVGQVMKAMKGKADPQLVQNLMRERLHG